jgi:hypothetical protein
MHLEAKEIHQESQEKSTLPFQQKRLVLRKSVSKEYQSRRNKVDIIKWRGIVFFLGIHWKRKTDGIPILEQKKNFET